MNSSYKKALVSAALAIGCAYSGETLAVSLPEGVFFKTNSIKISLNDVASSFFSTTKNSISKNSLSTENSISGEGRIAYIIDGDTAWVSVGTNEFNKFIAVADSSNKKKALITKNKQVKMRIGGINTAESVHRDKSKNTTQGKNASDYLKGWASNGKAKYECYDHGKYGRPICAIIVNGKDIGYEMIKNGYSDYVTSWGKHPYFDKEYKAADRSN